MPLMSMIQRWIAGRRTDDTGATMVEYAMLVSLIAVVCVVAVSALGSGMNEQFEMLTTTTVG
jgi:Flp pilus assembly pilin Flp